MAAADARRRASCSTPLLLWQPAVRLDANGRAQVTVPLNDALTTFRIVAVADAGTGRFGTGSTSIRATQDLQIISGLPPLVREDDQFRAQFTLRNTTKAAMKVEVAPRATLLTLDKQTVDIPAGESREVAWNVTAPAQLARTRAEAILWEIEARDTTPGAGGARDALKATQRLVPAVPLTVQQATLVQVDGSFGIDVKPPADAIPGRGGLKMSVQPKLAEGLPGVRDWFANYPFLCLEQKTSKAVGLRDGKLWQAVVGQLPTYLDGDGLASYFPPQAGSGNRGSDTLTAYLLAATHEASSLDPAFALSPEVRASMERGLIAFVEGRIQRDFWSPRKDLDMRKLAAIEALSRYGKATGRMLSSITVAPNQWPTHSVIDWLNVLRRVPDAPQREQRLAEATQILKSRLSYQGTKLVFSTEQDDYWWWLMQNGDVNTARLMLAVMDDPAWKDDMGRLANGFIARQQGGAWHTTTANLWGGLALEKFSAKFEATPVTGFTRAAMGSNTATVDWSKVGRVTTASAAGAPHQTTWFGAPRRAREPHQQRHVPALERHGRQGDAHRHAAGHRQALAHAAVGGRRAAQGTVLRRLHRQEDRHAGGAGSGRPVHPRRRAAREARGDLHRRHDLGGAHRPGARRRHHPGQRPGARLRDRDAGREARQRRQRMDGLRRAQLRSLARLLRVRVEGNAHGRVHRAAEQRRRIRAPADAGGSDVCARDVRRDAQPPHEGGSRAR